MEIVLCVIYSHQEHLGRVCLLKALAVETEAQTLLIKTLRTIGQTMPKPNKWSVWSAKYGRTPTWHKTKEAAVVEKDWLNHTMKLKPEIGEEFVEMGWTEVKTRGKP